MLIKLLIWIAVFYLGVKTLIRWASGPSKQKEGPTVKGEPKPSEMPFDPDDIVDATFEEHPADQSKTEE